jgi:hypothetical protein
LLFDIPLGSPTFLPPHSAPLDSSNNRLDSLAPFPDVIECQRSGMSE